MNNLFDQHYGTNGGYIVPDDANTASASNPSTGPLALVGREAGGAA